MRMPFVSVVICTKNRASKLSKCLFSISHLKYPRYEIFIVDSSSSQTERNKVKKLCKVFGGQYFFEPKIGLSVARNRGINQAKGEIIAFTDDDCIVDENWLSCGVRHFINPKVGCVMGRVKQHIDDLMSQLYGLLFPNLAANINYKKSIDFTHIVKFLAKRTLSLLPPGVGCNMFFRQSLFDRIGLFDEELGIGTIGGEELEMFYRTLKAGYRVIYDPTAVVYHEHEISSFQELMHILHGRERGSAYFWLKYILLGDPIAITIAIGHTVQLLAKIIRASLRGDHIRTYLVITMLKGWLKGFKIIQTLKSKQV